MNKIRLKLPPRNGRHALPKESWNTIAVAVNPGAEFSVMTFDLWEFHAETTLVASCITGGLKAGLGRGLK